MYQTKMHIYIAKEFAKSIAYTLIAVMMLVFIINMIDITRIITKFTEQKLYNIVIMTICRNYNEVRQLLPFITLIATINLMYRFSMKNELVVFSTLGISTTQILTNLSIITILCYLLHIIVLLPLNAQLMSIYNHTILNREQNNIYLTESGLWFKQKIDTANQVYLNNQANHMLDSNNTPSNMIINVEKVSEDANVMLHITIWLLDENSLLVCIISGKRATRNDAKHWVIEDIVIINSVGKRFNFNNITLNLNISPNEIVNSLKLPEEIKIWHILNLIKTFTECGFSTLKYEMYLNTNFAMPLVLLTMVIVGFYSSFYYIHRYHKKMHTLYGMVISFIIYFTNDIVTSILVNHSFDVCTSVIVPRIIFLVCAVIYHIQHVLYGKKILKL